MGTKLLKAISDWQVEATREASDLFYPIPELTSLKSGQFLFVIGRKGTGKTAIAEHLLGQREYNIFARRLSFKDFPFNILYALNDDSYPRQSQYISLWEFLIFGTVAKLMEVNNAINPAVRQTLSQKFPNDPDVKLRRTISEWITRSFGANVFGTGVTVSETRNIIKTAQWRDELDALADLTINYIDNCTYYILFDALDDDYREIQDKEKSTHYLDLLVGLFKACQSAYDSFSKHGSHVVPIIFLRSDIYELLTPNDKNKWRDLSLTLNWHKDQLQKMLAYRIVKSDERHYDSDESKSFVAAWRSVFTPEKIYIGDRSIEQFDFISYRTNSRPRDFISYLKLVASSGHRKGFEIVNAHTVRVCPGTLCWIA